MRRRVNLQPFSGRNLTNQLINCGIVVVIVISAFLLQSLFKQLIGGDTLFVFLYSAIIMSAWMGGFRVGLLATGIATILTFYLLINAAFTLNESLSRVGLLLIEGLLISSLTYRLRTNKNDTMNILQNNQDIIYSALQHAKISVYTNDLDLRYTWIYNPLLGFSSEDMIGKQDQELLPLENVDTLVQLKQEVIKTGQGIEKRIATEINGQKHTFSVIIEPTTNNRSKINGVIVTTMDVTENEIIQAQLREKEERYRTLFNSINTGFCICEMILDDNGIPCDYMFLEVNALFEQQTGLENPVGKTALELVPNLERHWIENYGRVALTREPMHFVQGSVAMGRWFDVYASPVGGEDNHRFALVFADISARRQASERRRQLQTLAAALSQAMTTEEVTSVVLEDAISGVGASGGAVAILTDDKSELQFIGFVGYPEHVIKKWDLIPLDHPTAPIALAIRENRSLWLKSPDERRQLVPLTPGLTPQETHLAWAVLPFNISDELVGAIALGFDQVQEFDESERTFLQSLTGYYAQALRRAQLTEQLRQLATDKERQRLSRDLHDSVQQLLFSSITLAGALPKLWKTDPDAAHEYSNEVIELNVAALAETRNLLYELRPDSLTKSSILALLENLCQGMRGRKKIDVILNYKAPEDLFLPEETHIALYRIIQEALNNIAKHSKATKVEIDFTYQPNILMLVIEDNGRGFITETASSGIGLKTMRERAEAILAELKMESVIDSGTKLTLKIDHTLNNE